MTFGRSTNAKKGTSKPQKRCVKYVGELSWIFMMDKEQPARFGNKYNDLLVMPRLYSALTSSYLSSTT
jgi:hypothetical protein